MITENTRESKIENYFIEQISRIDGLTYKFKSVERGVPDRLLAYDGQIYLIELKRPGEMPRKSQIVVHEKFKRQNIKIYNFDTTDQIDEFIKNTLKTTPKNIVKTKNTTILSNDQFKII